MPKNPRTAHVPRLAPPRLGSGSWPESGYEWETSTAAASRRRSALRELRRGSNRAFMVVGMMSEPNDRVAG